MHRPWRVSGPAAALGALALLIGSAMPALAGGKPTVDPLFFPPEGFDLPAGVFCDFEMHVDAVLNTEYVLTFPPESDGSYRQNVYGQLWIRVTNLSTGDSVDVKISGPARYNVEPDGTTTVTFLGRSLPVQEGQFLVTSGRVVQILGPGGSELLLGSGQTIDLCELLTPA